MRNMGHKVWVAICAVGATLAALAFAAAAFFLHIIPEREKKLRREMEAKQRADKLRQTVADNHEKRMAVADAKVAAVEEKAAEQAKADPVDVANDWMTGKKS